MAKKQLKKGTVFLVEIGKLMTNNKTSAGTKDCWYHLWSYDIYTMWKQLKPSKCGHRWLEDFISHLGSPGVVITYLCS